MNDLIKKALLLGIGGFEYTKDSVKQFINDLEKDHNITPEEGKKLFEEYVEKAKTHASKANDELKVQIKKVLDEAGVATKKDLEDLKEDLKTTKTAHKKAD